MRIHNKRSISTNHHPNVHCTFIPHIPDHLNREQLFSHLGSVAQVLSLNILRLVDEEGSSMRVGIVRVADQKSFFILTSKLLSVGFNQTIKNNPLGPSSPLARVCDWNINIRMSFTIIPEDKRETDAIIDYFSQFGTMKLINMSVKRGENKLIFKANNSYSIRNVSTSQCIKVSRTIVKIEYTEQHYEWKDFVDYEEHIQETEHENGSHFRLQSGEGISEKTQFFDPLGLKISIGNQSKYKPNQKHLSEFNQIHNLGRSALIAKESNLLSTKRPIPNSRQEILSYQSRPNLNVTKLDEIESSFVFVSATDHLSCSEEQGSYRIRKGNEFNLPNLNFEKSSQAVKMLTGEPENGSSESNLEESEISEEQGDYLEKGEIRGEINERHTMRATEMIEVPQNLKLTGKINKPQTQLNRIRKTDFKAGLTNSEDRKEENMKDKPNQSIQSQGEVDKKVSRSTHYCPVDELRILTPTYNNNGHNESGKSEFSSERRKLNICSNGFNGQEKKRKRGNSSSKKPIKGSKLTSLLLQMPNDIDIINREIMPLVHSQWLRFMEIKVELKRKRYQTQRAIRLSKETHLPNDHHNNLSEHSDSNKCNFVQPNSLPSED